MLADEPCRNRGLRIQAHTTMKGERVTGIGYAVISAFIWAINAILIRKGVRNVDTLEAAYLSIFPGALVLILISVAFSDLRPFTSLGSSIPWAGLAAFVGAGIFSHTLGRLTYFLSIRRIGPSRSSIILSTRIIIAPLIGIFLVGDAVTLKILLGAALMFAGLTVLSTE